MLQWCYGTLAGFHQQPTELKLTKDVTTTIYSGTKGTWNDNNIDRWLRLERASFRADQSIYRPETELSNQASYTANQSSEEVEEELMEHGYVVGRKKTTELMKLSKVVVSNVVMIQN